MKKPTLIDNWGLRLRRSYVVIAAVAGAAGPQVLQVIADQSGVLPWLDDGWKSLIRTCCLAVIPVLLIIKQENLAPKDQGQDETQGDAK